MENYLFQTIARGLGGLAYRKYGYVGVAILGDTANTFIQAVVYDAPSAVIKNLDETAKKEREVFCKEYTIADVDFTNKASVYQKIHDITSDIEIAFQ